MTPTHPPTRREWLCLAQILLLAAVLRGADLTGLPTGLHGDEAVVGLEAQRILREGPIGPYSPMALGQPAGPLYLAALSVRLLGPTVLAVRLLAPLAGTLTVAALWLLARRHLGAAAALYSAFFLAVMGWHLHFSRIGFPVVWWPLPVLLGAAAMLEAMRGHDSRWWAAAGAAWGLGVYVYNAHLLLLAVVGLYVAGYLALERGTPARRKGAGVAALTVALVVVALPMLRYALAPGSDYFEHFHHVSATANPGWPQTATMSGEAGFLLDGYCAFWHRVCLPSPIDPGDGTGDTPLVAWPMLALTVLGACRGLAVRRSRLVALAVLLAALMPLAASLTYLGEARRTFALAPLLALLGGLGLVEGLELLRLQTRSRRAAASVAVSVLFAWLTVRSTRDYFVSFARSPAQFWTFGEEMTNASRFMAAQPPGSYVYFYSERWAFSYETRRFLAPGAQGEDRSLEFVRPPSPNVNIKADPAKGRPVFLLLNRYRLLLPQIRRRYPRGRVAATQDYIAYVVME